MSEHDRFNLQRQMTPKEQSKHNVMLDCSNSIEDDIIS